MQMLRRVVTTKVKVRAKAKQKARNGRGDMRDLIVDDSFEDSARGNLLQLSSGQANIL